MKFNINDYVRVKAGVPLEETGEPIPGWVGRVEEITPSGLVLMELDSISLHHLPPQYRQQCIDEAEPPLQYYFEEQDLEPAERRDTDDQLMAAQEFITDLTLGPDEEDELDTATLQPWTDEFLSSARFEALAPGEQLDAGNIIATFGEMAFNYEYVQPGEWTPAVVREVCTRVIPRKMTADRDYFAYISPVLAQFFGFLHERQYLPNAEALQKAAVKCGPEIVANAQNPAYWGMAKSLMMGALDAGVDPESPGDMDRFIAAYNARGAESRNFTSGARTPKSNFARPARENPYKHLSRNQVIRVRYADNNIREGKFKRLEADLLAGKCTLVE